ncbi:MAG: glutamine amidotransferase, partial [Polyangiaceae bacterium]
LVVEMRRRERGGAAIVVSGILAVLALALAVLRPVRIVARESVVGARVIVLADASRSMALATDIGGGTRADARNRALEAIAKNAKNARFSTLGFGDGPPRGLPSGGAAQSALLGRSDLSSAVHALAGSTDERPTALIVVSDGRLDDPPADAATATLKALGETLKVPIHTVAVARTGLPDASVRRVSNVGAAVAHVPLPLRVDVGCSGGLACEELTVTARELREDGPPALLASALAHLKDGVGTVDMTVTLERAGPRIVEVEVSPPAGDMIPENDRRLVTLNVAREHVRVLHVAGRPTNDVRALRQWLKSDASVDVVAFFILRTPADDPQALPEDLALIPFPVDELFSKYLPTFDAVVLQDFDAQPYGLEQHLPALARYVKAGGGLIMVGGPNSFVHGGYAGTPLGDVLPVTLDNSPGATADDTAPFTPTVTDLGKSAPIFAPLRSVLNDDLPIMPGVNVLGDVRKGGTVLWTHPTRKTKSGAPMPVLAIGEEGDGRSIALGVDGGWLFEFSQLGARAAGRGFGAFWDGLLGWLMRDPRFEPAQIDIESGCIAGVATTLRVRSAASGPVALDIARLDKEAPVVHVNGLLAEHGGIGTSEAELVLPPLEAGGYAARLRIGDSSATRRDFACEAGGDEWADSRPDADRLKALANATGGTFAFSDDVRAIPLPKPTVVSAERHVAPIAPPWVWTLVAALLLGAHWFVRRRAGLA